MNTVSVNKMRQEERYACNRYDSGNKQKNLEFPSSIQMQLLHNLKLLSLDYLDMGCGSRSRRLSQSPAKWS